jgi:hypothetical protein
MRLRAGHEIVRERGVRPDEHTVFDGDAVPDRDAVFDDRVIADLDAAFDEAVVANVAAAPDLDARQNVGERPDPRTATDLVRSTSAAGWMNTPSGLIMTKGTRSAGATTASTVRAMAAVAVTESTPLRPL